MAAKLIQVIQVDETRGSGTEKDPTRWVTAYYSLEGHLLAVRDDFDEREAY